MSLVGIQLYVSCAFSQKEDGGIKAYSDILTFVLIVFIELTCRKIKKMIYVYEDKQLAVDFLRKFIWFIQFTLVYFEIL